MQAGTHAMQLRVALRARQRFRGLLLQRADLARDRLELRADDRSRARCRPPGSARPCSTRSCGGARRLSGYGAVRCGPSCGLPSYLLTGDSALATPAVPLCERSAKMSTPCRAALALESLLRAHRPLDAAEQQHRARMLALLARARRSVRAHAFRAGALHRERLRALARRRRAAADPPPQARPLAAARRPRRNRRRRRRRSRAARVGGRSRARALCRSRPPASSISTCTRFPRSAASPRTSTSTCAFCFAPRRCELGGGSDASSRAGCRSHEIDALTRPIAR